MIRSSTWCAALVLGSALACGGREGTPSGAQGLPGGGSTNAASASASSDNKPIPSSNGGTTATTLWIEPDPKLVVICGDGRIGRAEECDDGNQTGGDGCTSLCHPEPGFECLEPGQPCVNLYPCGDKILNGKDVCDDGNQTSGDGCNATCTAIEPGWQCRVPNRPCMPLCGDGKRVGTEECDDGPSNGTFAPGQIAACSLACTLVSLCESNGATVSCPSVCGNGLLEFDEECDLGADNNPTLYGGCTSRCRLGPYCGDGVRDPNEDCDPSESPVGVYGRPGCTAACRLAQYCGDGIIDAIFEEECDGGSSCTNSCHALLSPD